MSTHTDHLQKLQDWMELRNYSKATISAYRCAPMEYSLREFHRAGLGQFLEWREAEGFTAPFVQEEARRYLLSRYRSGKKWQTVNGDYSAMRKFYEHVLGHRKAGRGNGAYYHPDPARLAVGRALLLRRLFGDRFPGGTPAAGSGIRSLSRVAQCPPRTAGRANARSIRYSRFPQSMLNGGLVSYAYPEMPGNKMRPTSLSGTLSLTG